MIRDHAWGLMYGAVSADYGRTCLMSSYIISQFSDVGIQVVTITKEAYIVRLILIKADYGSNSSWVSAMAAQLKHSLTYTTNIFAGEFVIIRNIYALCSSCRHDSHASAMGSSEARGTLKFIIITKIND